MNCPGCGRFMQLEFGGELDFDIEASVFWWICSNDWNCLVADYWKNFPVPAFEYDWRYWCQDIPPEDFAADPGLRRECEEMYKRYIQRNEHR